MRNPPRIVEFEITLSCNLRCIHCYCMAGNSLENELSTDEIEDLMVDLKEMNVWALDIVGGEPFTRHDIFDLLRFAKDIGLRVMINTNGTLVDENVIEKLRDSNPSTIIGVSLDGPDPETNDLVRGRGSFEKALRGLKLFVEAGFDPVILTVINAKNWKRFEDMVRLARDIGVGKLYVDRYIPIGRGKLSRHILDMEEKEWMEAIEHVRDVIRRYENEMVFYVEENITGDRCTAGRTHASILANGYVVPCGHFRYDKRFYMGNVRERKFSEIWNSYDPDEVFKLPKSCEGCPLSGECAGGCRAVSLHVYGDVNKPDIPICALNRREGNLELSVRW